MKASVALLTFILSIPTFATSPVYGPFLNLTVGEKNCHIRPNSVNKLNAAKLASSIRKASKRNSKAGALHVVATNPPIVHSAGISSADPSQAVKVFKLRMDGSRITVRQGSDAADLIETIDELCK